MNRSIITQTWERYLDCLPGLINLKYGNVQSVTHVKYYDSNNDLQTLDGANYDKDLISNPARISRAFNVTYPEIYNRTNAVVVEFEAGFGDAASDVPEAIKAAMMLTIGHLYEHRENVLVGHGSTSLPKGAEYILDPFRIFTYDNR